jgi:hypothetical protein
LRSANASAKERRVCHSNIFDRYFSYKLSEGDISQGDLDEFVRTANEKQHVFEFFVKHKNLNLLRSLFERLLLQAGEIRDEKAKTVAKVLIDFCDTIPRGGASVYFEDESYYALELFLSMIGGLSAPVRGAIGLAAYDIARQIFEETRGLYLPVEFCIELRESHKKDIGRTKFNVTTAQLNALTATKVI